MSSRSGRSYSARAIERYLVDGDGSAATLEDLTRARLAGYAYTTLAPDDPRRGALRTAFLGATAAHLAAKSALRDLLTAWRAVGVEALIVKGFHLAEFVYAHPSQRPYADVDIVVHPERTADALDAARSAGWRVPWDRRASLYRHTHEEAILVRGGVLVEVQRYVIDTQSPRDAVPRRMTHHAWDRSVPVRVAGAPGRVPDPADALIMGVVQARAWSAGDRWVIRPTDYLDLRTVAERLGIDRDDIRSRALELGCQRSLDEFLRVCDPWDRRLRLAAPTRGELRARYLAMTPERGHLGLEWAGASVRRMPGTVADAVRALPTVWALRSGATSPAIRPDPASAGRAAPGTPERARLREKERLVRGIKWAARLVQPVGDRCRLRSLALVAALRARGIRVHLRSGVENTTGTPRRHYWIDTPAFVLRDLESEPVCRVDAVDDDGGG